MSTFGALNTAFRGLTAAQQGIAVAGNNIANATTAGYTRQRVEQSSLTAPLQGLFSGGSPAVGEGVSVDRINRLGNSFLDSGVRTATSQSGFTTARAQSLRGLENILQEPGTNSISSGLQSYWAAWQGAANKPGEPAAAAVLLAAGNSLATTINTAQAAVAGQWSDTRSQAEATVATINSTAAQVAESNAAIRSVRNAGGSANELIDARSILTETLSRLSGGTVKELPDGTINVFVDGNALVSGTSARSLALAGPSSLALSDAPVQLEWADRPGTPVAGGGQLAGILSVLAPPADGSGGALAEASASYASFAQNLATQVNTVHRTGQSATGASAGAFFAIAANGTLSVIPKDVSGIAVGRPGSGTLDGSIADAIAQLGVGKGSPDAAWQGVVAGIGVSAKTALQQDALSSAAWVSAAASRDAQSSVSLDEENISLLSNQHAYQAAARVMTAVDEALDVLINRTGLVGR